MDFPSKPNDRREFKVAIICALSLEADMVEMVFDKDWSNEGMKYGKAAKDSNAYTTGVIAGHNVVLAYCPGIGKNAAAQVATSMKTSFTGIRLALVVGICGAVPFYKNQEDETEEIVLGDCIISTSVVQFDFGRLGPSGFQKKDGLDTRGLANAELRGLMAKLKSRKNVSHMTKQLETHLKVIQKEDPKRAKYPGYTEDRLYEAPYIHTHHDGAEKCEKCNLKLGICDMECKILGCSDNNLINRNRLSSDACPQLHFGCFGSSDTVVKSGLHREELAKADEIIAFEMEGSGVWDVLPTIVVKAACDYADSHKNKKWQSYAAAVAASTAKALIGKLELAEEEAITPDALARALQRLEQMNSSLIVKSKIKRFNTVPFLRDESFVGRGEILDTMFSKLQTREPFYQPRIGLIGMGGVGKSQIVIEYAYRLMKKNPNHSVFWIFAANSARFEQSYTDIALQADLRISETLTALQAVHRWLSYEQKDWTLIVDNLDSYRMLIEPSNDGKTLMDYLPITDVGTIIVTSRSRAAASDLVSIKNMLLIGPMDEQDSVQLLRDKTEIDDEEAAKRLIHAVEGLPLAITHAGSFISSRTPRWTVSKYLESLETERSQVEVLYKAALSDNRRDSSSARTIQATFQISFIALSQENPGAANLLSLLSMFQNQHIPEELLDSKEEKSVCEEDRIDILEKYSLVVRTTQKNPFIHPFSHPFHPPFDPRHRTISIHRAVHMSLRLWLETKGELGRWQSESITTVEKAFPLDQTDAASVALSRRLLPHAEQVTSYGLQPDDSVDKVSLDRDQRKVCLMLSMIQYWQHVGQDSAHQDFCKAAFDLSLRVFPIDSTYNLILGRYHNNILYNSGSKKKAMTEQRRLIALAGDRSQEEIYFLLRKDLIEFTIGGSASSIRMYSSAREAVLLARNSLSELNKTTMDFWHRHRYRFALLLAELLRKDQQLYEAESVLRDAVAEEAPQDIGPIYWDLISELALVCKSNRDLAEARKLYSELVESEPEGYEFGSQKHLKSRCDLAQVIQDMHGYGEAANLQSSLVGDCIRIYGEESSTTLAVMMDHAVSVFSNDQREKGLKILLRADDLATLHLGPNHTTTMEITRCKTGFLEELHRWEEAEIPWLIMLAAQRVKHRPEYPNIENCLSSLIVVLEHQEKWEEAEQIHCELIQRANGKELHIVSSDRSNPLHGMTTFRIVSNVELKNRLFSNLVKQAKWEEARGIYHQLMNFEGEEVSRHAIDIEYGLSMRLIDLEARDHALVVMRSALEIALANEYRVTAKPVLNSLIFELEKDEKWEEAEPLYRKLFNIYEDLNDFLSEVPATIQSLERFAHNLFKQAKFSEVEILLHRVLVATKAIYENKSRPLQGVLLRIGEVLMYQYRYEEAEDFYRRSLTPADTDYADTAQFLIGVVMYLQGFYSEAEEKFAVIFRNKQDGDGNNDAESEESYEDGEDDVRSVQSVEGAGDEDENAESERSHEDENEETGLVIYGQGRDGNFWNNNDENKNKDAHSAESDEDEDEDGQSKESSQNDVQVEYPEPRRSAIWLHASIRAQHRDPSRKFETDLQSRFDAVIAEVRETPIVEDESLRMPADLVRIWTTSHELRIQKKHRWQSVFKKKHGIAKRRGTRSATRNSPSSRGSSDGRAATEKTNRLAPTGFLGRLKKKLS